jgi:predicted TIM-barrel fold metal-dependent hydrolase
MVDPRDVAVLDAAVLDAALPDAASSDAAPPPLVDINALLGRHPRMDVGPGTVDALLSEMDRVGVGAAVVGHTMSWLHDPATGNQHVVDLVRGHRRLFPAWVIAPVTCDEVGSAEEFLAGARAAGVVLLRAYPEDHRYDLAGPDVAPILAAAADARLPLLIDIAQCGWAALEAAARAHPDLPLILSQAGYRDLRRLGGLLDRVENVYVDLADLSTHNGLEWLVRRFGAGRFLLGTLTPIRDPADAVTRLLWSELDDDAVAAIGAANARDLLHLSVPAGLAATWHPMTQLAR